MGLQNTKYDTNDPSEGAIHKGRPFGGGVKKFGFFEDVAKKKEDVGHLTDFNII